MKPWRVTVVDGHFKRHAGSGIVMADTADAARALIIGYLSNDHAYAEP